MEIRHELVDRRGAFRAVDDAGQVLGSMTYVESVPGVILVQHTGVEAHARGQGVAGALFDHLVQWARQTATKVVPQCRYAHKRFMERPDTQDVLR